MIKFAQLTIYEGLGYLLPGAVLVGGQLHRRAAILGFLVLDKPHQNKPPAGETG